MEKFLKTLYEKKYLSRLDHYGQMGVDALRNATPVKTGATAAAWSYEIERSSSGATIHWTNSNTNRNLHIAVILQYGHGTNHGGYVQGIDYINPALRPIFDKIAEDAWLEVTRA